MVLLTVLKKARRCERDMRILILGLDNSGKTTFLNKINGEDITKIAPTFGFNIKTITYKSWKLNCWDVGGQKSLRSYWRNYFERTDAVIWVVDSSDVVRMADCKKELHLLINEECLYGVSLLILANKSDLDGVLNLGEITKMLDLDKIKQHHYKVFETSAYTNRNLLEALDWLCNDVASRILIPE